MNCQPTVLIVGDECHILNALSFTPRSENYRLLTTNSAKTAVDIVNSRPVDLVIADLKRPVLNNCQLIQILRLISPRTQCIICGTIDSCRVQKVELKNREIGALIAKSWNRDDLKQTIRLVLAGKTKPLSGHWS
jgi:response regulator RpfG family c-di-GMP phosphodiesterase